MTARNDRPGAHSRRRSACIADVKRETPQSDRFYTIFQWVTRILEVIKTRSDRRFRSDTEMNFRTLGAAAVFAIAALPLHAQTPANGPIETRLEARKVVRASDGREARQYQGMKVAADVVASDIRKTSAHQ